MAAPVNDDRREIDLWRVSITKASRKSSPRASPKGPVAWSLRQVDRPQRRAR